MRVLRDAIITVGGVVLGCLLFSLFIYAFPPHPAVKHTMLYPSADSFYALCAENGKCMPIEGDVNLCFCTITPEWDGNYECNDCNVYQFE